MSDQVDEVEADGTEADVDEGGLGAPSLGAALEALLLLADEPMTVMGLASAVRQPAESVEDELRALSSDYTATGRGFDLREVAGGWRAHATTSLVLKQDLPS